MINGFQQNINTNRMNFSSIQNNSTNILNSTNLNTQNKIFQPNNLTQDTLKLEDKAKKEAQKKTAIKIGVGVALGAIVIAGGILLHKKMTKLPEKIEFKEADNIDDAIKFAKENLGIKKVKGFGKEDLGLLNWTNEGLSNINNMTKGKAKMPKKIILENIIKGTDGTEASAAMGRNGILSLSKDELYRTRDMLLELCTDAEKAKYTKLFNQNYKKVKEIEMCIVKNGNTASKMAEETGGTYWNSRFKCIYHEMGHLQHQNNIPYRIFCELGKESELKAEGIKAISKKGQEMRDLFSASSDIAKKVSSYAKTSPAEFVAECFAKKASGAKLSPDAMKLYEQLGGAMIL